MFNFMLLKIKEKYLKILVIKTVLLLNLVFKNFDNNNFDQQSTSFQAYFANSYNQTFMSICLAAHESPDLTIVDCC